MPCIVLEEIGGEALTENVAIITYLAERFPEAWLEPEGLKFKPPPRL